MSVPSLTELILLKALWRKQPLSARENHDSAEHELGWSYSSTRKTLERMLEKGMVSQQVHHGVQELARLEYLLQHRPDDTDESR